MINPVIFREYDIRGIVDKDFNSEFAYLLGRAHARLIQQKLNPSHIKVTVGHDARYSSPKLYENLIQGFIDSGVHVIKLGLITSPISYFSTFSLPHISGAIMVTGSHNPPNYNGFKISLGNTTIFGESIQQLRQIIERKDFIHSCSKGSFEDFDIFPLYINRYKNEFPSMSSLKVVLDCGNGASGVIARKLYQACGLNPIMLFEQPDGSFPNHHPDPTIESNMIALKNKVLETQADIGIGFDGDADRIGVIDHSGRFLLGDELMILFARDILVQHPGAKVIGDVKCSDRMYTDIKQHGGIPIMWKTGHSLIKEKIKSEKAPFGGEMSGHIFFNDRNYGYDDALYAGLRLCEIVYKNKKSVSQLLCDLPSAFSTPEIRIDTTEEKKKLIVQKLIDFFKHRTDLKINLLDGIRISYPHGWALARASNTQPVLVLRFEAASEQKLKEIQSEIYSIVNPLLN